MFIILANRLWSGVKAGFVIDPLSARAPRVAFSISFSSRLLDDDDAETEVEFEVDDDGERNCEEGDDCREDEDDEEVRDWTAATGLLSEEDGLSMRWSTASPTATSTSFSSSERMVMSLRPLGESLLSSFSS